MITGEGRKSVITSNVMMAALHPLRHKLYDEKLKQIILERAGIMELMSNIFMRTWK